MRDSQCFAENDRCGGQMVIAHPPAPRRDALVHIMDRKHVLLNVGMGKPTLGCTTQTIFSQNIWFEAFYSHRYPYNEPYKRIFLMAIAEGGL